VFLCLAVGKDGEVKRGGNNEAEEKEGFSLTKLSTIRLFKQKPSAVSSQK